MANENEKNITLLSTALEQVVLAVQELQSGLENVCKILQNHSASLKCVDKLIQEVNKVLHNHKTSLEETNRAVSSDMKAAFDMLMRIAQSSADPTLLGDLVKIQEDMASPKKSTEIEDKVPPSHLLN